VDDAHATTTATATALVSQSLISSSFPGITHTYFQAWNGSRVKASSSPAAQAAVHGASTASFTLDAAKKTMK
jgi:hypothetical protein